MKTMYLVRPYTDEISEIGVIRETDKFVFVTTCRNVRKGSSALDSTFREPGQKMLKDFAYHTVFATLQGAIDHITARYENRITSLKETVERESKLLSEFREEAKITLYMKGLSK